MSSSAFSSTLCVPREGFRVVAGELARGGKPEVMFQGSPGWGLVVDDRAVYFTDNGSDKLRKVDKGSLAVTDLASGLRFPDYLAQDAEHLYFTAAGGGGLRKLAKTGGAPVVLDKNLYGRILVQGDGLIYADGARLKVRKLSP